MCGIFILGALVLEAHLGLVVFRRSRSRRMTELPRYFNLQLTLYTIYAVLTIIASLLLLFSKTLIPFIFMSTLPLVVYLLFGTGPDILRIWFCCASRERGKALDSADSTELSSISRKERGATVRDKSMPQLRVILIPYLPAAHAVTHESLLHHVHNSLGNDSRISISA
ncbi:hypothetical protein EXIGLDRAFT_267866 [Exidia glandulosa HHB12029]|uniref:Uncharacterized protein n=1 Tax=Exidia glandulosa HHB12029 TaxID=1314781 RepID=A0A165MCC2_EXIGL|nr:hypothetical protein EXIGLDRAFT_267866 [Exidia glandulosa HHB12029]